MELKNFTPVISEQNLNELRKRLLATRLPQIIGKDDWKYGVPTKWLEEMIDYWANTWRWESVSREINRYENFKVEIVSSSCDRSAQMLHTTLVLQLPPSES